MDKKEKKVQITDTALTKSVKKTRFISVGGPTIAGIKSINCLTIAGSGYMVYSINKKITLQISGNEIMSAAYRTQTEFRLDLWQSKCRTTKWAR